MTTKLEKAAEEYRAAVAEEADARHALRNVASQIDGLEREFAAVRERVTKARDRVHETCAALSKAAAPDDLQRLSELQAGSVYVR